MGRVRSANQEDGPRMRVMPLNKDHARDHSAGDLANWK